MRMQIFRVEKPSCKILKMKNCVPFELQYYIRWIYALMNGYSTLLHNIAPGKYIVNKVEYGL